MFEIIQIDGCDLIVYDDGTVWRWFRNCKWAKVVSKSEGYYQIKINKKLYCIHRIIAHAFKGFDLQSELDVDHLDRNIHNNSISNLEPKTHQQNLFNTDAKGYTKRTFKNGTVRWITHLKINGKQLSKCFKTEYEAKNHYLELKAIHHVI